MDFLTVREVAALMHVSPKRMYTVLARGLAPSVKIGGRRHVPRAAWDAWCAELNAEAAASVTSVNGKVSAPDAR